MMGVIKVKVKDMATHQLKTWPTYWDAIDQGKKNFEVRRNDRAFQTGDVVELYRTDGDHIGSLVQMSVEPLRFRIGWLLQGGQFGIEPGYCVFSLLPVTPSTGGEQ